MYLSAPITARTGSEERSVASGLGGLSQSLLLQFGWGFPTSPSWSIVDLPLFFLFCGDSTDLKQLDPYMVFERVFSHQSPCLPHRAWDFTWVCCASWAGTWPLSLGSSVGLGEGR